MQGWDNDKNRQKVDAEGKLAASADQHDLGELQQGQQQHHQHHMVSEEEGDINNNLHKKKMVKKRVA